MKILNVVQCYHPAIGGSEQLVRRISEQLVARYGDAVTVFTSAAYGTEIFWRASQPVLPPGTEVIDGVTVRRFKVYSGLRFPRAFLASASYRLRLPGNDWLRTLQSGPIIFEMPRAIAESGAEVIFATAFPFLHMYYARAGARKVGTPLVYLGALHTAEPWNYDRDMIFRAIQQADAYVAHTAYERDYLLKRGVAAEKIRIIGGGVAAERFMAAAGAEVRARYGWGDEPVVAALARQAERKRLDVLLQAMPLVWAARPETRLLLAGARTFYSERLDRMIAALPARQRARVTSVHGFPEADKPKLLAASDLLVHPTHMESFGIVLIEAWACGKPVIGVRHGVIASVVDEGRDGLLCAYANPKEMAQAILTLLDDPAQRAAMGRAGQQKVLENYTWEIVTDRLRGVFEAVVG